MYNYLKQKLLPIVPSSLIVPLKKRHYVRVLRHFSATEEPDLQVVESLVKPGSIAIDIGANVGVYTKFLSHFVGRGGTVVSVEPIAETYSYLVHGVEQLALENVRTFNRALSDVEGKATMVVPTEASGEKNFYQAHLEPAGGEGESVVVTTLDRLSAQFDANRVSFIKIDVEGFELACCKGGLELLRASKPACLIEISQNFDEKGSPSYELARLFDELGYRIYWFDGTRIRLRKSGDRSINYFFLTDAHLEMVKRNFSCD